jgi:hypothetical protein
MDEIDSILNDFDAIYAKADKDKENAGSGGGQQGRGAGAGAGSTSQGGDDDELAVMDFMTAQPSSGKHQGLSMESNDNLDDEINSFMRKNSKTENVIMPLKSKGKKKGSKKTSPKPAKKSVTISEMPAPAEEEDEEPMEEEVAEAEDDNRYALSDEEEEDVAAEEDEDEAADDDYADDAEEEEEEGEGSPSKDAQQKERPYQTDMTRPVVQYGKTKLTYGEAKLYGLLDERGEVRLQGNSEAFARSRAAVLHSRGMAERKEPAKAGPSEEEREMTFKPARSKEASKAMNSRGCGYDFVRRLDEGGGFMQRTFARGEKGKSEKRLQESQKEDFEARQDRLKCPNCNKFQAFDEFIEKKRSCQQCHVRYAQSSVSHPQAYARKQQEAEQRKKERLKKMEDELYPQLPKPTGKPSGKSLIERTNELMEKQKNQARQEQEQKRQAEADLVAKARAPAPPRAAPRPATVRMGPAEEKPPRPHSATAGAKSSGANKNKLAGAVKQSIMSQNFNKLIQYPSDSAEVK